MGRKPIRRSGADAMRAFRPGRERGDSACCGRSRGLSGRGCGRSLWCLDASKSACNECPQTKSAERVAWESNRKTASRLLTHVVPQIPASPASAGTRAIGGRGCGHCLWCLDASKSACNECPQTKSAERVASGVQRKDERSTPHARGSADAGLACICGHSCHRRSPARQVARAQKRNPPAHSAGGLIVDSTKASEGAHATTRRSPARQVARAQIRDFRRSA